jgi:hypothetical protein
MPSSGLPDLPPRWEFDVARVTPHLSRRGVLAGITGCVALSAAGRWTSAGEAPTEVRYLSCAIDRDKNNFLVGLDERGSTLFELPLPARGHGMAVSPDGRTCIAFARQPGRFAAVVDLPSARIHRSLPAPPSRYFDGHGSFSADGRLLYATQSDLTDGAGFIGIYDAEHAFVRIGEFPAGGIGPHDMQLWRDGTTLVVAVGGILSDLERKKLNIPAMQPRLVYLDAATGEILESVAPPPEWHKLSIRHVDIGDDGRVVVGMQYEGDKGDTVPLLALHRRGGPLRFLRAPGPDERSLDQYVGSVAFDAGGGRIAATSQHGGVVLFWHGRSGSFIGAVALAEVSGVAAAPGGGFIATGAHGAIWGLDAALRGTGDPGGRSWDNHLIATARA